MLYWAQSGAKGKSKLHEEIAQMSMVPTDAIIPSILQHVLMGSWNIFRNYLTEKEKTRDWLIFGFVHYSGIT